MRLLRMALEEVRLSDAPATQDPTIVMRGPLSEVYTKALDVIYAKFDPVTNEATVGEPASAPATVVQPAGNSQATATAAFTPTPGSKSVLAVETQANDALMAQAVAASLAPSENALPAEVTIYGVTQSNVTDDTVVEVINTAAEAKSADRDFILVIDATQSGPNGEASSAPQERMVMVSALESLVESLGHKVYHSLDEVRQDRKI